MPNEVSLGNQDKKKLCRFTKTAVRIPCLIHTDQKANSGRSCARKKALSILIVSQISTGFLKSFLCLDRQKKMKSATNIHKNYGAEACDGRFAASQERKAARRRERRRAWVSLKSIGGAKERRILEEAALKRGGPGFDESRTAAGWVLIPTTMARLRLRKPRRGLFRYCL
jgi:hypothetical protein